MKAICAQNSFENPLVSVAFITFNHAGFVEQALRSVLAQETRFPVEVVIGDDCSTDGTSGIIQRVLAGGSSHAVKYLLHQQNLGGAENSNQVLANCSGDYIAPLEGDDYWTDTTKLQQQVDMLEASPDASLCFHNCEVWEEETGSSVGIAPDPKFRRSGLTAEDMLYSHMIQTNTKMWRRELFPSFGACAGMTQGDRAIDVLLALRGKIIFIDKVMSVYRRHSGGMWTGASQLKRDMGLYQCFNYLFKNVPDDFKPKVMHMLVAAQAEVIAGQKREKDARLGITIISFLKNLTQLEAGQRLPRLKWLMGVLINTGARPPIGAA